ncbi:MAG: histidine phosphatase family protein [Ruminococcus sp.]|nr:histidine phosphatase family protein [Ruminococcus sp.]
MKLLLIRHGEPDYANDCLTDLGRRQAERLGARLKEEEVAAAFTSPMGRARETADIALGDRDVPLTVCDWLHEFDVAVRDGGPDKMVSVWDMTPKLWTRDGLLYDREGFAESELIAGTGAPERYEAARRGLDALLAERGLVREGGIYRRQGDCCETLAFFCHFGATCVLIAHLLGVSPVLTLQGFSAEPTAIATLCTDDRFGSEVNFRLHGYGDISHLDQRATGRVEYK